MNNTLLRWSTLLIISILSVSSAFSYSVDKEKVTGTIERTFSSEGPNPVVTFTVYEPTGKEEMNLPPNVDFWRSEQVIDEDGVSCFKSNNGRLVYNVSTVAFQAMGSASSYPNPDLDELAVGK